MQNECKKKIYFKKNKKWKLIVIFQWFVWTFVWFFKFKDNLWAFEILFSNFEWNWFFCVSFFGVQIIFFSKFNGFSFEEIFNRNKFRQILSVFFQVLKRKFKKNLFLFVHILIETKIEYQKSHLSPVLDYWNYFICRIF